MHDEARVDAVHPAVGRAQLMRVGVASDPVVRLVQRDVVRLAQDVGGGQSRHSAPHHGCPPPLPCHSGSLRFYCAVRSSTETLLALHSSQVAGRIGR
ncbi:hypothetical protein Smic_12650 [Streptomyces microflavus]|uniref:Uncharacterized protein n=1 Tax=Streptomyces microflavus TaxID=1919 RepID=A0A7J0CJV0_STRMI|nr:hypothetical protein Smic_12650 [Streptomyces microflavus]